jgi:hypothetical protein
VVSTLENHRQNFRPVPMLVDSTRRNLLIRWQKRAAMWEHGLESRSGLDPLLKKRNRFNGSSAQCIAERSPLSFSSTREI